MIRSLALCLLLLAGGANAADAAWPGGVAFVDLGDAVGAPPRVEFQGKRVLVSNAAGRWQAVVGIPLDAVPGTTAINLPDGSVRPIQVLEHSYREQHLSVAPGFVALSDENLARVAHERTIIDAALNNWRELPLDGVTLHMPVDGSRDASFGSRRFFNKEPRSPHSGMDIAVGTGTPIRTPRDGLVTAIGNYYFNGNTVILDHGQGFVTMYCHLSDIAVTTGQQMQVGEILGAVGATGRVTGAHLHFGTYLNGNAVDPALLLEEVTQHGAEGIHFDKK